MTQLKRIIVFFVFTIITSDLSAQYQNLKNKLSVECNYHYGFVMPHSEYISYFVEKHIQAFQINIGLNTQGNKPWHQSYNNPQFGLGYVYSGLSNDKVYGKMQAIFIYTDRYYLPHEKRVNFGNRLALGVAMVSKHFDINTDPVNLAIGSKFNAYVNYSIETTCRLFPKAYLKVGLGLTHISNGSFAQPNKGLNMVTGFTGLVYNFSSQVNTIKNSGLLLDTLHNQFYVSLIAGRKQISRRYNYSYTVEGICGEYLHHITGNSWGGASLSLYYDPSLVKELELTDSIRRDNSHNIRLSLNIAYELKMGRISYVFQPGFYIINPFEKTGIINNKLAVRYQISNNLVAGVAIKAHWFAIADFFEWSIGYRWKT